MNIEEKITAILHSEAQAILNIKVNSTYQATIEAIRTCEGKIVTIGMGKAGHIARKFAATLCSTGTSAIYLHPAEAAHGDLGLVEANDCIVAFSTSGKTPEVIEMLELSRQFGIKCVIGITSHPDSRLRDLSDIIIDMGPIQEPCPLGLTPSASVAVMLAISDALALVLMELNNFTKEDFGLRHRAGYLGQQARLATDVTP